jgi:hypothetical protein
MKSILIILVMSFTGFVNADYALRSEIKNKTVKRVYTVKPKTGNYMKIPKGYGSKTHKVVKEMVDDYTKPVWGTRSMIEICTGEDDCKKKSLNKDCTDERKSLYNAEYSEVWCNRVEYYLKKESGREIVEIDEAGKIERETSLAVEEAVTSKVVDMEKGKRIYALIQVSNRKKGLTKVQRRQLRNTLRDMRDDLFDGNICEVRSDVMKLAVDGTVITDQDKAAVISQIDSIKVCP